MYWLARVDAQGEPQGRDRAAHDLDGLRANDPTGLQYVVNVFHLAGVVDCQRSCAVVFAVSNTSLCCGAVNGGKHVMEVPDKNVRDIFEEVDFHCSQIETEYEKQGKSID